MGSGGAGFRLCSRNILLLQVHTSSFYVPLLSNTQPFPLSEEMSQQPSRCMSRLNFRVQQLGLLNALYYRGREESEALKSTSKAQKGGRRKEGHIAIPKALEVSGLDDTL